MNIIKISFNHIRTVRSRDSTEDREEMKLKRMCRQKSYGERKADTRVYILNICVIRIFIV